MATANVDTGKSPGKQGTNSTYRGALIMVTVLFFSGDSLRS